MHIAYLSLGSNLNNPINQVNRAIIEIENIPEIHLLISSSLYKTPPIGPEQPDFINAVVKISTTLSAHDLLLKMQKIELDHQRERTIHWGPRTLDIDLILYDQDTIRTDILTVPHPFMQERAFVLVPLLEISSDLQTPQHGDLKMILKTLEDRKDIHKILEKDLINK
ncbi:2-amino-4-hydroxy-6-hydroxymethyldihydropteridine diphosphokinase [Ignatzschineria sp. LJL83]